MEARNCDREGETRSVNRLRFSPPTAAATSASASQRLVAGLFASAALVVVSASSPVLLLPDPASAKEVLAVDDDPISFFQLRGSVAKKYAIEEIEESDASPSSSSPSPLPSSSSRVVKRKSGLTVAACVAEDRGPRGGELSAALASASGAAGVTAPSACGRAEDESRADPLPRACASACSSACSVAVERKDELLRRTTGFSLGESAARRLSRRCARACAGECVRPSTSSARALDFFVNFGR